MTAYQRRLLAAIDAESRERRGPCPQWLAAVAVNAGGQVARDTVDAELIQLVVDGLLTKQPEGLALTAPGRAALAQALPAPTKSSQSERKPLPAKATEAPKSPSPPAPPAPSDDDAELDLIGYQLMVDLAKVVLERLRKLGEHDPDNTIERMRLYQLAQRFMGYFERLEAREEARP